MFKKPRSLQFFRMHELSLCVLCFGITSVRVRHNPKSSALQTPAAPLTPCPPASAALLLCQTTVICDWAPIDRTAALSPAEINAVTSSLLPGSMLTPLKPDGSRAICFSVKAKISQRSWHVRSICPSGVSADERVNEHHSDSPNSCVRQMTQN